MKKRRKQRKHRKRCKPNPKQPKTLSERDKDAICDVLAAYAVDYVYECYQKHQPIDAIITKMPDAHTMKFEPIGIDALIEQYHFPNLSQRLHDLRDNFFWLIPGLIQGSCYLVPRDRDRFEQWKVEKFPYQNSPPKNLDLKLNIQD